MDILSEKIVTTRKKHHCDACGRRFEPGTNMSLQVNTYDGIGTWRTCLTCKTLMDDFRDYFYDEFENVFHEGCVSEQLQKGQTPEELLIELKS